MMLSDEILELVTEEDISKRTMETAMTAAPESPGRSPAYEGVPRYCMETILGICGVKGPVMAKVHMPPQTIPGSRYVGISASSKSLRAIGYTENIITKLLMPP